MTPEDQLILGHIQHVARQFFSWRGQLAFLLDCVIASIGESAPPRERLENFLRRESTQKELAQHWETALWIGPAKDWRLVNLATTTDPNVAARRLQHKPDSPRTQCRYCLQDEKGGAALALVAEKNIHGHAVPASFLHPGGCLRSWRQLRALAEYAESEKDTS